jgi:hypothetical protein
MGDANILEQKTRAKSVLRLIHLSKNEEILMRETFSKI